MKKNLRAYLVKIFENCLFVCLFFFSLKSKENMLDSHFLYSEKKKHVENKKH